MARGIKPLFSSLFSSSVENKDTWFPRRPEHISQGVVFVVYFQTGTATEIRRVVGPHLIKIYLAITSQSELNNVR